jgi:5-methylcytosine-specific restriction enzyme subunit McrC
MTVIELVEHAPAISHPLPDRLGRGLADLGIVDASPDPYSPGRWMLRAGSSVGAVRVSAPGVDPLVLRITPKVPIARLFFLLGYRHDPKGWRDGQVDVSEHRELLPALAHAFERQTERALGKGLLQGYRTVKETSPVVRGRVHEAEQIRRRFGAGFPVEIIHDEFTIDIAENRLIRSALERLLLLPGVPSGIRRGLLHQRSRLADATPLPRGRPLPTWQPTRLNARYHHALHLAAAILDGASAEHSSGALHIDGFLFDMNKLFEDFVTLALRAALAGPGRRIALQDAIHLDTAQAIRMLPDFVLYRTGSDPARDLHAAPLAVADAKYKAEKRGGYPDADLYQMLAYCTALDLPEGHLVYAKGNAPHASHRVRRSDIVIHQHAVDLDQPPDALLHEIGVLAHRIDWLSAPIANVP